MEVVLTLIWLAVALLPLYVGYKIAKKKNRSTGKALLLTLFTGWLGVIIIAVLEDKKICKHCNAKIPANNYVCSICGKGQA
jgi:hypothetical protein